MRRRILVLLNINNILYKFLSIFQNESDPSFYIYQHTKDEKSPITVGNSFHLLKSSGTFNTSRIRKKQKKNGDRVHLSIHPKRIYLKRLNRDGSKEHMLEECEPQSFNKKDFRLHATFTPPPISHMGKYSSRKNTTEVIFPWNTLMCPQISIYELGSRFSLEKVDKILPLGDKIEVIPSDGVHPTIALHLKSTNGDLGVWRPNCSIFARIVKKKPVSKQELQEIIKYNELNFDISSIPDNAVITDYKVDYPKKQG